MYDLKAVNPREKKITDTRTPAELLGAISEKKRARGRCCTGAIGGTDKDPRHDADANIQDRIKP